MRSLLPWRKQSTAGSKRMPINMMVTLLPSLWKRQSLCGKAAGFETMTQEESVAFCEKLFAKYLDGHPLMTNAQHLRGSAHWIKFPRVICDQWVHWDTTSDGRSVPYVLMGDAAHTAHFSIGSGTKLALEDAIELADTFERVGHEVQGMQEVMTAYQATRSIEVLKNSKCRAQFYGVV
jgi:anthraniloyl-CoA monooxygenase